jgi:cell division protease FtsH
VPLAADVDLERIARGTPGLSGADLANVVNEAALLAARRDKREVDQADLETAKDKVAMGAERRSLVVSPEERRRTAYHEAGHAAVARLLPECDPVNKVTIVPRGFALGLTQPLPQERHAESRSYRLAMLTLLMGGRSAEEVVYGEQWTGAEADIRNATRLARQMVCVSGMSEALGPVAWGTPGDDPFAARPGYEPELSAQTAERIDAEVRRLLDEAHAQARALLTANRPLLDAVAAALLERETLDAAAFEAVVRPHLPDAGA